jgi:hypothetical protein
MPQPVQVGTILLKELPPMPPVIQLETEPFSGSWSLVKSCYSFALDQNIHAAGWNFFFMAPEIRGMFLGPLGAKNIRKALKRILSRVKQQHFNALEVTGIVTKRFLGIPYTVVTTHSCHIQRGYSLESVGGPHTFHPHKEWTPIRGMGIVKA